MRVVLSCRCGQSTKVSGSWISEPAALLCDGCQSVLLEPSRGRKSQSSGNGDLPVSLTQRTPDGNCPQCGQPMAEDAVVCVECGLDLRTGKRLRKDAASSLSNSFVSGAPGKVPRPPALVGIDVETRHGKNSLILLSLLLSFLCVILIWRSGIEMSVVSVQENPLVGLQLLAALIVPAIALFAQTYRFRAVLDRGSITATVEEMVLGLPLSRKSVELDGYQTLRAYGVERWSNPRTFLLAGFGLAISAVLAIVLKSIIAWEIAAAIAALVFGLMAAFAFLVSAPVSAVSLAGSFKETLHVCPETSSSKEARLASHVAASLTELAPRRVSRK